MKAGNSSNPTETVKKTGAVTKFTKLQTGEKSSQCSKWRTPPKHFSCLQNILFQKLTLMLGLVTRVSHVLKCYSQYSRFKLYPCNKTRIPPVDPHIYPSHETNHWNLPTDMPFPNDYVAPWYFGTYSDNLHLLKEKNISTSDWRAEPSCNLDWSEPKLSGQLICFIKWCWPLWLIEK